MTHIHCRTLIILLELRCGLLEVLWLLKIFLEGLGRDLMVVGKIHGSDCQYWVRDHASPSRCVSMARELRKEQSCMWLLGSFNHAVIISQ